LSESDFSLFPDNSILHLPFVLGAISFFHLVPTSDEELNLSPCVLAKILNLNITDWTYPEILKENPNLSLPSPYPIKVAHCVQGSSLTTPVLLNTSIRFAPMSGPIHWWVRRSTGRPILLDARDWAV
jgi:ABC-type phosphate transport system substrate-binding protein